MSNISGPASPEPHHLAPGGAVDIVLPGCGDPDCRYASTGSLRVAATPVSEDTYRIEEVPTDSVDVGFGDVVLALRCDGQLEFVTVLERVCVASASFAVPGWVAADALLEELSDLGVKVRSLGGRRYLANLVRAETVPMVVAELEHHRVATLLCDHETLVWRQLG